jgi:hypothetical protein
MSFESIRSNHGCESAANLALATYEKLGEIPFDRPRSQKSAAHSGEVFVQWGRRETFDVYLCEQGKGHVIIELAEALDFSSVTRLLVAELVARKSEHGEPLRVILTIQCLEASILRRKPTLAGNINDEKYLAAIRTEALPLAIDRCNVKIVQFTHG